MDRLSWASAAAIAGATVALSLVLTIGGWVGFIGSDDVTYAIGGQGWLSSFPYVGGHGSIREPITMPIALSFALLGESEVALVLPSLIYAVGLVAMTTFAVARGAGAWPGVATGLLLATSPLLTVQASIAGVDAVEAFFLFASLLCFLAAGRRERRTWLLIAAGALAALGFLTRETAAFLIVFYGILFLVGYGIPRRSYWVMALGFMAVWGMELVYLTVMTGDPLYRINIALHHDSSIDRSVDLAGNLIVHPFVDPILLLLVNQEFMLLFWALPPAVLWIWLRRAPQRREAVRLLAMAAGLGVIWIVAAGASTSLLPLNPRYFMVCAVAACIVIGMALGDAAAAGGAGRLGAGIAMLAILAANAVGTSVENRDYMFGERMLVALAASAADPIHTDPMTHHRAKLLLEWAGLEDRVLPAPPPADARYLFNPLRANEANRLMPAAQMPNYQPKSDWAVEGRWGPTKRWSGHVLEATGIGELLPAGLRTRLSIGHPGVILYRAVPDRSMAAPADSQ